MTTITIGGTDINYSDFEITVPVSTAGVAPTATVVANARESVTASDSVTIDINGETVFDGVAESGGTKSNLGGRRIKCEHRAVEFFDEEVSLDVTGRSSAGILADAQAATDSGSGLTLTVVPSGVTLDYSVENRPVKRVFRDICDRNGWVWWVDPATDTITVDTVGGRGTWKALDAEADGISVDQFDSGNVDTVRNKVTVVGTGEQKVEATALDTDSRSTYGTRSGESPYNVSYITTQSEAANMADALLVPDPLAEGKITVPRTVGDIVDPLVNYTVDLTDDGKDISATGLLIEQQTIEQGRATLQIGQGNGESIAEFNRKARSRDDTTEPGTVLGSDRLADGSVDTNQLVDTAVIEQKLADASVTSGKLVDLSVTEQKLDNLSVALDKVQDGAIDTVKITDSAIETPKLSAGAVTAAKILADTITANEIASRTITALEIESGTISSNEIAANTITAADILADTITGNEIAADTITTNELSALDVSAENFSIVDDVTNPSYGMEFLFDTSGLIGPDQVIMRPIGDQLATLGDPNDYFTGVYAYNGNFQRGAAGSFSVGTLQEGEWAFNPTNGNVPFVVRSVNGSTTMQPNSDASGFLGSDTNAYNNIYAYNFIDADTGSALSDGGNVLANLKRGDRPPEHCRACDDDGEEVGIRINSLTRHLWRICTAQQERLEAAEQKIDDLESRLSDIEAQL